MEEVDKIIIDSIRHLNCNIDEEIGSLKQFTPDMIVNSIVCCLEAITPGLNFPRKMPASMSVRLKLATALVEHIQQIGFRGDLGYQTILYSNEVELRRVLMFLIERLPRESNKITTTETIGYVPRLVKEIEDQVKFALDKSWLPTDLLYYGARKQGDVYFQQSFGNSTPLHTEHIQIPNSRNCNEELKRYWVHDLPEITKQCSPENLIPSLLFKDNEYSIKQFKLNEDVDNKSVAINNVSIENVAVATSIDVLSEVENPVENKIIMIVKDIDNNKSKYKILQDELKNVEAKHTQMANMKCAEELETTEILNKLNVKKKTLTVLSKDENMAKLKTLVENGNERLLDLASQWNDVQTPLIEQYKSLQSTISQQELKNQEEKEKLFTVKNKIKLLEQEIVEKDQLEIGLLKEHENINRTNNRTAYTRRILEIIANIKKQDGEIGKILTDTKQVQKEIKQLTGQLDRSFTQSDGLIFKDAKQDEAARKAYKLLATLHFDCESVVQSLEDLGLIERETRNLQDQIEVELDKDMKSKLKCVVADIEELKKEHVMIRS